MPADGRWDLTRRLKGSFHLNIIIYGFRGNLSHRHNRHLQFMSSAFFWDLVPMFRDNLYVPSSTVKQFYSLHPSSHFTRTKLNSIYGYGIQHVSE